MIEETIKALIEAHHNPVYIGDAPIDVDDVQWLRSTTGLTDVFFDKNTYDYPNYIVYARGVNNRETKDRIESIYHILLNYVGSGFVILAKQLPRYVGRDKKHRAIYSFRIEYQLGGY